LAIDDIVGQTTQVFNQNHRNVIEIARVRQWSAVLLIALRKRIRLASQSLSEGPTRPGEAEYARIPLELPIGEYLESWREIGSDCKNQPEAQEIVHEAIGRGRRSCVLAALMVVR